MWSRSQSNAILAPDANAGHDVARPLCRSRNFVRKRECSLRHLVISMVYCVTESEERVSSIRIASPMWSKPV